LSTHYTVWAVCNCATVPKRLSRQILFVYMYKLKSPKIRVYQIGSVFRV